MSVRFAAVTDVHLLLWSLQKISQFRRFGSSEMPCARCLSYLLSQETRSLWQNETNSNSNHLNSASAALRKKNPNFLFYPNSFNIHYKSRFLCLRKLANNVIFTARNGK